MLNKKSSTVNALKTEGNTKKPSYIKIIHLKFDERYNEDCVDSPYGCTCISYEKCCGCLLQ